MSATHRRTFTDEGGGLSPKAQRLSTTEEDVQAGNANASYTWAIRTVDLFHGHRAGGVSLQ